MASIEDEKLWSRQRRPNAHIKRHKSFLLEFDCGGVFMTLCHANSICVVLEDIKKGSSLL
jgi:hypothetical protein